MAAFILRSHLLCGILFAAGGCNPNPSANGPDANPQTETARTEANAVAFANQSAEADDETTVPEPAAGPLPSPPDVQPQDGMSAEELQFRRWLIAYLNDPEDEYRQNLVYGFALVDLNGDGRNEAVVWARDQNRCGTSGCQLQIFVHRKSRWAFFARAYGTRPPIKLLPRRYRGWRDLAAWQAGSGIWRPYEGRLRFNGKEYDLVEPADWTGVKPRPPRLNGQVLIKDATIALFPSACRKVEEEFGGPMGPVPFVVGKPGSC